MQYVSLHTNNVIISMAKKCKKTKKIHPKPFKHTVADSTLKQLLIFPFI